MGDYLQGDHWQGDRWQGDREGRGYQGDPEGRPYYTSVGFLDSCMVGVGLAPALFVVAL